MLYRISLHDVNANYMTQFPLVKKEIDKLRGKELGANDTAKLLPDIEYALSRDRRFRRKLLGYLLKLRSSEKKKAVMPYMEAIVLHDNEWQSMSRIIYIIYLSIS